MLTKSKSGIREMMTVIHKMTKFVTNSFVNKKNKNILEDEFFELETTNQGKNQII